MASIKQLTHMTSSTSNKMIEAGVRTIEQLLEVGASAAGRLRLADRTHIDDSEVQHWVHQADLLRIKGMQPDVAELLYMAGVSTTPKLAYRATDSLYAELVELNARHRIMKVLPSPRELHTFITQAKTLPKLVRH